MAHNKCSNYDTHIHKMVHYKMVPLAKISPQVFCQGLSWVIFKGNPYICNMIQTHGILKSNFSNFCLTIEVAFISRVLVVLQKTNNGVIIKVIWCHFCEIPFLWDALFVRCHYAGCHFSEVVFSIRGMPFL